MSDNERAALYLILATLNSAFAGAATCYLILRLTGAI